MNLLKKETYFLYIWVRGGANPLRVSGVWVIFCRLLFGNFAESLAYSKCACLNALYYPLSEAGFPLANFSARSDLFLCRHPFWSPRKPSKLRSAKKGRPKSDLSTINDAFTNHWNRNITGTLPPAGKFESWSQILNPDPRNLIFRHQTYIHNTRQFLNLTP
jgi:hypothetical protein